LVVLQQTYQEEIPPLPYLTFLAERDRHTLRVDQADTWFQVIALVGIVVAASLAWITG
jgi:hypothetical protein